jgi:Xaa-Pro aminopeptidase
VTVLDPAHPVRRLDRDGATVDGRAIPDRPDLARMRRARHARLQAQLEARDLDGLLLLGTSNVTYATGAVAPGADGSRARLLRPVALVVRGEPAPHLFTPYPEGAPPEVVVHPPLWPDLPEGTALVAAALAEHLPPSARLAVDEQPHPILEATAGAEPAGPVVGPAKLVKTVDELACIRAAQRVNERAMLDVQAMLRPGLGQVDLTARFLHRVFELGADTEGFDPIWQVMPASRAAGPWTTTGDVAYPTGTNDRVLERGDVLWVDSGILLDGYASDFGRTWLVGADPTPRQQAQHQRWCEVMAAVLDRCVPGATGLDLARAATEANGGTRPWLEHFFLVHGTGTDGAEQPMIGTDLGEAFDEQLVLAPGMVLTVEPVIWEDGWCGYRAEDTVAITDDGWVPLSDHHYEPFDA